MADWLILLLKYGGFGAVLLLALFVMGKWLLKRITAALDSYTTAYLQQKAAIDARIEHLEQLADEQARLTRAVENVRDEIAAQRRLENNRWDFKREVYLNLVTFGFELLGHLDTLPQLSEDPTGEYPVEPFQKCLDSLFRYACIAELATADELKPVLEELKNHLSNLPDVKGPEAITILRAFTVQLRKIVLRIRTAGRKDLWGDSERKAQVAAA